MFTLRFVFPRSSADQVRMRNEANAENKKQTEYHNHIAELSAMYKKVETLETRLNQLNDNINNQQQDMKQSFNVLHQCLLANKEEEKKKQRNANNDDRYLQDRLVSAISQNVNSMIGNEVEYLIKQEISGNVLPCMYSSVICLICFNTVYKWGFLFFFFEFCSFEKHDGYFWATITAETYATLDNG